MKNIENIIGLIKDYIKTGLENSAIIINGEWGSGKTYFINNSLIPFIDDELNKKSIYVTLNGVSNKDDISKDIFFQSIPVDEEFFQKWMGKIKPYGSEFSKILINKFFNGGISVDYSNLSDLSDCVIILDDLERCLINNRELMGYINKFVEHMNIKTIIVANEEEIGNRELQSNKELKYYIATLDSIEFTKEENSKSNKKDVKNDKIKPETIKKRILELFGSEINYNEIKEKLVSKTILFEPDINISYDDILSNYSFDEVELDIIKEKREDTSNRFIRENHNNLRTLQFIFMNFQKICEKLKSFKLELEDRKTIIEKSFQYLMVLSVRYKKYGKVEEWSSEGEYGDISISGKLWQFDIVFGFGFINELVINSYLDVERMESSIKQYLDEQRKNGLKSGDSLIHLSNWWYLEDKDVKKMINDVNSNLSSGVYQPSVYPKILSIYLALVDIGFCINIDEIFEEMTNKIHEDDISSIRFDPFGYTVDEKYIQKYNEYIEEIKKEISTRKSTIYKNKINDYLVVDGNWSQEFMNYIDDHKNDFLNRKKFFSLIDVNDFCDALDSSKNEDILNIRAGIKSVYNFSNLKDYYLDDLPALELIVDKLNDMISSKNDSYGNIKTKNLEFLLEQLKNYISKLE